MGDRSAIEWTDSTWNPTTGCTRVTSGCDHCYAATLAHGKLAAGYLKHTPVVDTPLNRADPFAVRVWENRLDQPLRWRSPRVIFVNSMSDVFHADVPDAFARQIFEVMLKADWHTYQVLTKRPSRAARFFRMNHDLFPSGEIPRHIWMGTSVENQDVVYRVDQLRRVPAAIRFLSCEPLLGPLQLELVGINWVIVGGESGIGFRPMEPHWPLEIRDQCEAAGTAFFFKQWGGRTPKARGRVLDGRTYDDLPALAAV